MEFTAAARAFAIKSVVQRRECGRLGKGHDRLESEWVSMGVVPVRHAADGVAEYLDRRLRHVFIVVGRRSFSQRIHTMPTNSVRRESCINFTLFSTKLWKSCAGQPGRLSLLSWCRCRCRCSSMQPVIESDSRSLAGCWTNRLAPQCKFLTNPLSKFPRFCD